MRALWVSCGLLFTFGCGASEPEVPAEPTPRTETDQFGLITCSGETANETCVTHRAILGVSMGASGAGQLGLAHPELFDTIGMLGVPLVDWVYMLRNVERSYLGGFCDQETILANIDAVDDPDGAAFCGPVKGEVALTPDGRGFTNQLIEPDQDFNHWYRWIDQGRGGSFGRGKLLESLQDISLAYGNPTSYNEESPYYAPGIPMDYRFRSNAERCSNPLVLNDFKHWQFNPDGSHPVIAFCDTSGRDGLFHQDDPANEAVEFALAVDYNNNGQRDYAEPVLLMMHERYEDVGDGMEDPFDWQHNPASKAANWRYDEGEPFLDYGLDGVPNTGDYGEDNGKFDYNPNVDNYYALNPRHKIEEMDEGQLKRLNIWADAGIRDFLYSAGATNWLWSSLQQRVGADVARDYTTFEELTPGEEDYEIFGVDFDEKTFGKHAYLRYGDPDATERQIERGNGHHVGSAGEVINRFLLSLAFTQSRFVERDVRRMVGDEVTGLIQAKTFMSTSINEEREFGIMLPPGYGRPENADQKYPVVYFLHGQGMESDDLLASAILFYGYMSDSSQPETERRNESDWGKFILVFPDSTCSQDACRSGNFNTNHKGLNNNGPAYQDSIYELMAYVEANYRVAVPTVFPKE